MFEKLKLKIKDWIEKNSIPVLTRVKDTQKEIDIAAKEYIYKFENSNIQGIYYYPGGGYYKYYIIECNALDMQDIIVQKIIHYYKKKGKWTDVSITSCNIDIRKPFGHISLKVLKLENSEDNL